MQVECPIKKYNFVTFSNNVINIQKRDNKANDIPMLNKVILNLIIEDRETLKMYMAADLVKVKMYIPTKDQRF